MTGDYIHHYEQARDCLYAARFYSVRERPSGITAADSIRLAWRAVEHAKAFAEALEQLRVAEYDHARGR